MNIHYSKTLVQWWLVGVLLLFLVIACKKITGDVMVQPRFSLLDAQRTGIHFRNDVPYSDTFNCYIYRNFYNGGGVGIGDVNNDDLPDLFFCGNMTSNKLYLNRGNFHFDDITDAAGLATDASIWSTGVALADVNGDGWLDIYVCKSGSLRGRRRHNELFINRGTQPNGTVQFEEQSRLYHLDNVGLSTHAAFFDYDHDGDLDCYLLNNSTRSVGGYDYRPGLRHIPDPDGGNKLLRNDGLPVGFVDVSREAGIFTSAIGFGLGVTIGDFDADGWEDIFVANDFFEKDYLYRNLGNGKFEEVGEKWFAEMSKGSMGADLADLNNDGLPELFVTEMTPPDDARYKTKAAFDNWNTYQFALQSGYHRQFGRNVLQKNNGNGSFSEIGRLSGAAFTDWSWGALLADFDNDGWRDIFVANGIAKDLLDQDYLNFYNNPDAIRKILRENPGQGIKTLIDQMPSQPLPNFLFKNLQNFDFRNVAKEWGLAQLSFSNGSAYADLDNDGDLDLVVNNFDAPCSIYRNESVQMAPRQSNWLKIKVVGDPPNTFSLGTKVYAWAQHLTFYHEIAPMRGFESCVDTKVHLGLGNISVLDSILIIFPNGKCFFQKNLPVNQQLLLHSRDAHALRSNPASLPRRGGNTLFQTAQSLPFLHQEYPFSDFDREALLFQMYSAEGPKLAVADVDGDQRQDFFVGGARGQAGQLFLQKHDRHFIAKKNAAFENDKICEDVAAAFFDADGDGDLDLYVGSGSNEFNPGDEGLQDRLYLNDGKGNFSRKKDALPAQKPVSTACVRPADVDNDGDQDLFVGMRMLPGNYGQPVGGLILLNDGKAHFSPAVQEYKLLAELGMVTDACWADVDADGDPDLAVVGEWQPLRIFINHAGELIPVPPASGVGEKKGWWNCIRAADLNADGRLDFVVGNHGHNSRFKASEAQPMSLWLSDFDKNGWNEPIICQFNGEKSFPVVLRNDLVRQMPALKKRFLKFSNYQNKTIQEIFSPDELKNALHFEANFMSTAMVKNLGNQLFEWQILPTAAQIAPTYAIEIQDFTGDGLPDILLGGNHERCKPEVGTYLASYGVLLRNEGNFQFSELPPTHTGLKLEGVVRDMKTLRIGKSSALLVARNNAGLLLLPFSPPSYDTF